MSDSMPTYRCLIVDDETLAQELIELHIEKIPQFELVGKCHTAMEALGMLKASKVDILFLDIQMPDITGIEFLKSIPHPPATVLTTAYSEYALEGFDLNVIDYLLKPITFERFFKAANKLLDRLEKPTNAASDSTVLPEESIYIKTDGKLVKVDFKDILFIEGMQKYVKFHLPEKRLVTLMSLTKLEEILPADQFMRVHKSYIAGLNNVNSISGNKLEINGTEVPVSKLLRSEVIQRLDKHNLH
jgi:DNA-binding LytR/AlgR family response regulator